MGAGGVALAAAAAAAAASGVPGSAGRKRGLRRSEGGGVGCSSLMQRPSNENPSVARNQKDAKLYAATDAVASAGPERPKKDSLAVGRPAYQLVLPMIKRLLLCSLVLASVFSSGCVLARFRKSDKPKEPKESSRIASDVEREFKQRWIAKRVSDLANQGITGPAAQDQANREFQEKFNFPTRK